MDSGSFTYTKGDLITIRQGSMILICDDADRWDSPRTGNRRFQTALKPINGVFLGEVPETPEYKPFLEYVHNFTPLRKICKIGRGTDMFYVSPTNINFCQKRRRHEKVN